MKSNNVDAATRKLGQYLSEEINLAAKKLGLERPTRTEKTEPEKEINVAENKFFKRGVEV